MHNYERTLLILDANMPRKLWDGLDGFPYDDNGSHPDGDLLPKVPLDDTDSGVQAILDAGYGVVVDALYFYSPKDVIEYVHGQDGDPAAKLAAEWAKTADSDEVERVAWDEAQNLGTYAARYADVIVVANRVA
jgi:hypothetical protein